MWEQILHLSISSSFLLPSIFRNSAAGLDTAIRVDDAHCFSDESFRQMGKDNSNVLPAALMGNHLIAYVQGLVAT